MTEEKRPYAGGVTNVPKTYRDVYWCWIINEPMIIKYNGDQPKCSACDNEITFQENPQRYTDDHEMHTFMFHVLKPISDEVAHQRKDS